MRKFFRRLFKTLWWCIRIILMAVLLVIVFKMFGVSQWLLKLLDLIPVIPIQFPFGISRDIDLGRNDNENEVDIQYTDKNDKNSNFERNDLYNHDKKQLNVVEPAKVKEERNQNHSMADEEDNYFIPTVAPTVSVVTAKPSATPAPTSTPVSLVISATTLQTAMPTSKPETLITPVPMAIATPLVVTEKITTQHKMLQIRITSELLDNVFQNGNAVVGSGESKITLSIENGSMQISTKADDEFIRIDTSIDVLSKLKSNKVFSIRVPYKKIEINPIYTQMGETNTDIATFYWFFEEGEYKYKVTIESSKWEWLMNLMNKEKRSITIE